MLGIYDFTVEYRESPIGVDCPAPRFGWKLQSGRQNVAQRAYQIIVAGEDDTIVWDSGRVESGQSVAVPYGGEPLAARTAYQVALTVTDNSGESAEASCTFETGLMEPAKNFTAQYITHGFEDNLEPAAVFVKEFAAGKPVKRARLYATALGVYEFTLNGENVSDVRLAPGWTYYDCRLQYQTYDLTPHIRENNRIEFTVGNGWYKGILGFYNTGNHYGERTALLAQIELTYEDGTCETIGTDGSWLSTTGPIRYSEWYHGETIDLTLGEQEAVPVRVYEHSKEILVAQQCEPVRVTQRLPAVELLHTPNGEAVLDFGQNLAGVVEARVKYPRGTVLTLRHGEALDENGNLYTKNLRTAKATDTFICSGGEDVFLPKFTNHGFRYVSIESSIPVELDPAGFTACVVGSDLRQTGFFESDNALVNRLWQNIDWTQRSNFVEIPTDCPQRDERLGYTGDAQFFIGTALCNRNAALFFEKWLQDVKAEQERYNGGIPTAVPDVMNSGGGMSVWHDAGTVIPWALYQTYGDLRFLEEQFDSMKGCVEFTRQNLTGESGLVTQGQQLGDWVALDVERGPWLRRDEEVWNLELPEKIGATDPHYVANVYYLNSIDIVAKSAELLGYESEAKEYRELYERVLAAIRAEYITPTGRLLSDTQTGLAMGLQFGVCEEKDRPRFVERLCKNLENHKNHLATGFAGTRELCRALSENGRHDLAGKVFLKEDCPSWLYHVKLGGTTVWELWDGVNPDGSFNKFEMNSLNQYAYASIGEWIYKDLCGLQALEPGYKHSLVKPRLIEGVTELSGGIETVYGRLGCKISCKGKQYTVDVEIPANTTALVDLPGQEPEELGSWRYHFEYGTEDDFVRHKYNKETVFGDLLKHPVGSALLKQYAAELLSNGLFMTFAAKKTIEEISAMLPPEAMQLMELVLARCNAADESGNK